MNTLIFQITFKQWDKGQASAQDKKLRDAVNCQHVIHAEPEFIILDMPCIIDQHILHNTRLQAVTRQSQQPRKLDKALLADGRIKLDRYILSKNPQTSTIHIGYQANKEPLEDIGELDMSKPSDWIQASYTWRYSVEENNQIFWLYEEVTINFACINPSDKHYFLNTPANKIFNAEA